MGWAIWDLGFAMGAVGRAHRAESIVERAERMQHRAESVADSEWLPLVRVKTYAYQALLKVSSIRELDTASRLT